MTKGGLGRGLSALIPTVAPVESGYVQQLPVASIAANPHQPRQHFDEDAFGELVASIREVGVVQPIVVRPKDEGYELIAGERRWRAAQAAELDTIPAIIKDSSDSESFELALIENLQREDLNPIEEANAYQYLSEFFQMKQEEVAKKVGKSRVSITNTLRLLRLGPDVQQMVVDDQISSGHAKALLGIENPEQQLKVARKVIDQGLTVRQVENIARLISAQGTAREAAKQREPQPQAFKDMAKLLGKVYSAKVSVKMVGKKGKIEISVPLEKLTEVVEHLLKDNEYQLRNRVAE